MRHLLAFLIFFVLALFPSVALGQDDPPRWIVCAIGDSQVEEHSYFIEALRIELGEDYEVWAEGRRGWTAGRWIRSGDFASTCAGADIVLISLGGNDVTHGWSWRTIRSRVQELMDTLPEDLLTVYHMPVPRFYRPTPRLEPDGIHLSPGGGRTYARMVARHLRVHSP